jgi:hypothetical protein
MKTLLRWFHKIQYLVFMRDDLPMFIVIDLFTNDSRLNSSNFVTCHDW